MAQWHILVVDDEPDLCEILRFNLEAAGYAVSTAYSAEVALGMNLGEVDLMLLDVMMPGMSGYELAQKVDIPVIFLTAKSEEEDKLEGFRLGADDYIAKPFSVREVMARVKAVLSRIAVAATNYNEVLQHEGLVMNLDQMAVSIDGSPALLTKTEFELLHLLMSRQGQVLSRQELMEAVWPDFVVTVRTVDVNITRLRKKLGRYAIHIVARQGYGYVFENCV
ncbi:MAG: response regulator transcription factor [Bacteroidaceae bacterium]|nr:response regulator transcription factor [Bacteroidaceae bacterium]